MTRRLVLSETDGIISSYKTTAPPQEQELRTVKQPRKPGKGKPQNPPPKEPSK
jgi:hypothetical protein